MRPAQTQAARDGRRCIQCDVALVPLYPRVVDPQTTETFSVLRCPRCGLGHTEPIPDDLTRYYGEVYYGEGRHLSADFWAWRRARFLDRHVAHRGLVVDVGCGTGEFLQAASRLGWRVAGTELPDRARSLARRGLEVRPSLADFRDLAPLDAITMWHSLEHFLDPAGQLALAYELLADDGRLIIAVPDLGGIQARWLGRFGFHLDVPRHLFHFDRESLAQLLERAGLTIEQTTHRELEYDLFGWMQSVLNAVITPPNVLFGWLVGRPVHTRASQLLLSVLLGVLLFPFAVIATVVGSLLGRGATLKVVARKRAGGRVTSERRASTR